MITFLPLSPPTDVEVAALMPYAIYLLTGVVAILCGTINGRAGQLCSLFTLLVGSVAAIMLGLAQYGLTGASLLNGAFVVDHFGQFLSFALVFLVALSALVNWGYDSQENLVFESYGIMLLSAFGMIVVVSTLDLVMLFVGIEIMSLGTYVLVALRRTVRVSAEASLKYFILGGISSAILLYGTSLLYGMTGTVNVREIAAAVTAQPGLTTNPIFCVGLILVMVGFLFKVGSFPFHIWIPDVYEGAAASVTAFMISAVKVAAFGALLRFTRTLYPIWDQPGAGAILHDVLWISAVLTMFFGNIVALVQTNLKRIFAYSTISHTGYLLVGLIAAQKVPSGASAVVMYLFIYGLMSVGAFAGLVQLAGRGDAGLTLEDVRGAGLKNPLLGLVMVVFLLSMAGIPPTAGFIGKYYMFSSAVESGEVWLTILAVLSSVIGAAFYLRIIVFMFMKEPAPSGAQNPVTQWPGAVIAAVLTAVLMIKLGVVPATLSNHVNQALTNIAQAQ